MGLFECVYSTRNSFKRILVIFINTRVHREEASERCEKAKSKYMNSTNRPHPSTVIRRFALVRMI